MWRSRPIATPPGPGQESVWDYPRPPRVEPSDRHLRVTVGGQVVAETRRGVRVLETASPPTFYFPPEDVRTELLRAAGHETVCEFKGVAEHFDLVIDGATSKRAAWSYKNPNPGYEQIAGYFAFYPSRVDSATVDDEPVRAQTGGYYGGWITADVVGPFKGDPGTGGW
ncbi:MAG: DUF427 domain-containing protein [Candidatus Limnocylindrales bacterium]